MKKQNFFKPMQSQTSAEAMLKAKNKLYKQLEETGDMSTEIKETMHEFEFWDFRGQKFKLCLTIEKID